MAVLQCKIMSHDIYFFNIFVLVKTLYQCSVPLLMSLASRTDQQLVDLHEINDFMGESSNRKK
jgi:hypothetical protein